MSFVPSSASGALNFFLPASTTPYHEMEEKWYSLRPGQIAWHEFDRKGEPGNWVDARGYNPRSLLPFKRLSFDAEAPLHRKVVGRFVRVFRLWRGPPLKLADWRQLPADMPMMLSPDYCEAEENIAYSRQGHLARRGEGRFDVETYTDGSLWVTRRDHGAGALQLTS